MKRRALIAYFLYLMLGVLVHAAEDDVSVSQPHNAIPPNMVSSSSKPMVMLAASKDHTLFGPIYNDYEDVDDDGIIDVTYKPNFKYYGYFDSSKCYTYINGRFEPDSFAQIKSDKSYKCIETKRLWSGNFMNWATTSRLDVVRKMLYGGKRYVDEAAVGATPSVTVLEAAYLSSDAHSFVKHYAGNDIRDFTPFSVAELTLAGKYGGLTICNRGANLWENGVPTLLMVKGNYRMWGTIEGQVCAISSASFGNKLVRYYIDADKGAGKIQHELLLPHKLEQAADYGLGYQYNMRVRVCVPALLGEERCQAFPANSVNNFKPYGIFQEFALGINYPAHARVEFGVITGSYDRNINAGALRKNMGDFQDEINLNTGVFCHSANSGCSATLSDGRGTGKGAIKAFDSIVLFGRADQITTEYTGSNAQLPHEIVDGMLPAWGNPLGEMVMQALNYYAGLGHLHTSPPQLLDNSRGLFAAPWKDPFTLGTSARKNYYGEAACRPMYNLAISSSASSFDYSGAEWFNKLPNIEQSLLAYTDKVGHAEGIHGTQRSVGSANLQSGIIFGEHCSKKLVSALSEVSGICPESPGNAGTYHIAGAALYANTRKIRNLSNPPSDLAKIKDALRVKMLSASLAGGVARIEIPIPNSNPRRYVYITPESIWNLSNKRMPGAMLTFESISSSSTHGAFVVTWNDAQFGGDYDMDIAGFIRYDIIQNASGDYDIQVKTDIINVSAGAVGTHGFSIIGVEPIAGSTQGDGRYLTHRSLGGYSLVSNYYPSLDAPLLGASGYECAGNFSHDQYGGACSVGLGSSNVRDQDYPVIKRFKMVGVSDVTLKEPLWYAAKYGGFDANVLQADGTYGVVAMPPNTASWDKVKADGSPGADGIPDNYFLARRPEILEAQLRRALEVVVQGAYSAPAVSSPVALQEGEFKYEATFDNDRVFGQLKAFRVQAAGSFTASPVWEAGQLLHTQHAASGGVSREIITNEASGVGVPFRWSSLSTAYQAQMTTASKNKLSVSNAQLALNYIRGAQTHESGTGFRVREGNLLGPIVNAAPWVQTPPKANRAGTSYKTFYETHKDRPSVLWVASNDGMLHAFNYQTGAELIAYVPGVLANRLAEIPLQRGLQTETKVNGSNFVTGSMVMPQGKVWPYVDGSPFTGDVMVGSQWYTYLFGSLGRGGKAVYALNVTSLSTLKESTASEVFRWQFTSKDDEDLGYITSKIQLHSTTNQPTPIVKLNDGKYALLLGNGHQSAQGRAVLFILYADGPLAGSWNGRYRKIVLDAATPQNGLSAPQWEDIDGNGTADVLYAGDLQGGMWKVDLSSSDPTQWKSAYSQTSAAGVSVPVPFFRAQSTDANGKKVALPITTQPTLMYMGQGGLLVNFVTGNAFSNADFPSPNLQHALFGVWDRGSPIASTAPLLVRTLQRDSQGDVTLAASAAEMDWNTYRGWRASLPASGEVGLSHPFYTAGVWGLVTTRPMVGQNVCIDTPRNALLVLDPISGRAERDVLGNTMLDGVNVKRAGKDISEAELIAINDRRPPPKKPCAVGEPGCICQGTECSKSVQACPAGYRMKAILGSKTDEAICYNTRPRMHWREIPELRTYP